MLNDFVLIFRYYTDTHGYPMNGGYDVYNPAMMYSYVDANTHNRMSTADSGYNMNFAPGAVDYNPNLINNETNTVMNNVVNNSNNNKSVNVPKNSNNSDGSSSGTLGNLTSGLNGSLQGSLISVNSGRPPSTVSKTRNITQV